MSAYEDAVTAFRVPKGAPPLEAADAFALALEPTGAAAYVMKMLHPLTGNAMVHVHRDGHDDDVFLVHTGDPADLRERVRVFFGGDMPRCQRRLVSAETPPPDVAALFGVGPLARMEQALANAGAVHGALPVTDIPAHIDDLLPRLADGLGVPLDLADPDLFHRIDDLVLKLRPGGTPPSQSVLEGVVEPNRTLLALGLVASEAVRRRAGGGVYGVLPMTGWRDAKTLGETGGAPALRLVGDKHLLNVVGKVAKRWANGTEDSVADLWRHVEASLQEAEVPAEAPLDEAQTEARCELLDRAFADAGSALAHALSMLDDRVPPGAWIELIGAKRSQVRLVASGSGEAHAMTGKVLASDEAKAADYAIVVVDVFVRDPTDGARYDAVQATVKTPGKAVDVTLVVPYRQTDDAGVSLRHGVHRLGARGVPDSYDLARLAAALFSRIPADAKGSVTQLPREVSTAWHDAIQDLAFAGKAETAVAGADLARLVRLASLAPLAAFIAVASADGKVEADEARAFQSELTNLDDPVLLLMVASATLDLKECMILLMLQETLRERAFAAAGAVFAAHPKGSGGAAAFKRLAERVARSHGEAIRPPEQKALDTLNAALVRGPAFALDGVDPFPALEIKDHHKDLVKDSSSAIYAAFLLVAAADGEIEAKETEAFAANLQFVGNPLLRAMIDAAPPGKFPKDAEAARECIAAAKELFDRHPEGDTARDAFLALLLSVAWSHGTLREPERAAIATITRMLNASKLVPALVIVAAFALFAVVAAWQVLSAALGVSGAFVPVAIGLQVLVLLPYLFLGKLRQGYLHQVIGGTLVSVLAAVGITATSLVVTAVIPSALPEGGSALGAALGGCFGTSATGLFVSALGAIVLRRR